MNTKTRHGNGPPKTKRGKKVELGQGDTRQSGSTCGGGAQVRKKGGEITEGAEN